MSVLTGSLLQGKPHLVMDSGISLGTWARLEGSVKEPMTRHFWSPLPGTAAISSLWSAKLRGSKRMNEEKKEDTGLCMDL